MWQRRDLAVKPQVDSGDRRRIEVAQLLFQRLCQRVRGKQRRSVVEWRCQHCEIKLLLTSVAGDGDALVPRIHGGDGSAQKNFAATFANIADRAAVEIGKRHAGNTHLPCLCRLQKRLAKDLKRVADRNTVQIFIQRAHQYDFPEMLDRAMSLAVAQEPLLEIFWRICWPGYATHGHECSSN